MSRSRHGPAIRPNAARRLRSAASSVSELLPSRHDQQIVKASVGIAEATTITNPEDSVYETSRLDASTMLSALRCGDWPATVAREAPPARQSEPPAINIWR